MAKRQREKLLFDDPRWSPVVELHKLLSQRTGDPRLAAFDLTAALANNRLRCMRRNLAGEREAVPSTFWTDYQLCHSLNRLKVFPRARPRDYAVPSMRGWIFYVWQPDFDRIFGPPAGSAPVEHDDDSDTSPPVKPGRSRAEDWPTLIAQWLIAVAADDPQRLQNVDALVVEAQEFLDEQIQWSPSDDKVLRAKIRELLKLIRR